MKTKHIFITISFLCCVHLSALAQYFWIPDAVFRAKVKQNYPMCFSPQDSLDTTCVELHTYTTSISWWPGIQNVDGLQFLHALQYIDISNLSLTSLPKLPVGLKELICSYNNLTSLPALPAGLKILKCGDNLLDSLPALPDSLEEIFCNDNLLTQLPKLPSQLKILKCHMNYLTSLPTIPGKTRQLDALANQITCFPVIKPRAAGSSGWTYIDLSGNPLSCVFNQGTFPLSVLYVNQGTPFCNSLNNACNYNYTRIQVFLDANGNGVMDSLEIGLPAQININSNSSIFTDNFGYVEAYSDTDSVTFSIVIPNYYVSTLPAAQTVQVQSGIHNLLYFGLQALPNVNDLSLTLNSIHPIRPGFSTHYYMLNYKNSGTTTYTNCQIKFLKPTQLLNLATYPPHSAMSGDTLIWNLSNLSPFGSGTIQISDSVNVNAVLGDTAIALAWIEPIMGDTTPVNNSASFTDIVVGSFDPNDKSVVPNELAPNTVTPLEYAIRFQNTGNASAINIMVSDSLSPLLDVSSIEFISSSHSCSFWVDQRIAYWNFTSIALPDSNSNEPQSHGFIKFRIKPKSLLSAGTSIHNLAAIFFDFNSPVITNDAQVQVVSPSMLSSISNSDFIQLYPVPAQQFIQLQHSNSKQLGKVELQDLAGRVLETRYITQAKFNWPLHELQTGLYFLKGEGWTRKFMKN